MSSLVERKRAYVRLVMLQTIFVQKIVQYLWSIWELLSKGLLPYLCIPLSQQGSISWYFDESENVMCDSKKNLKPGFHMSGKSQTIRDFTVSRLSWFPTLQILPINENWKPYISLIVWDGRGQIWRVGSVSILPTVPDFCDGRRSFTTNENSNLCRRGRRWWISLITNPLRCWAPVPYHT